VGSLVDDFEYQTPQRQQFAKLIKSSKCPRDGYRVLEVEGTEVVCEKCCTKYVASIDSAKSSRARPRLKLVERYEAGYW
jgi:hypothetical protein